MFQTEYSVLSVLPPFSLSKVELVNLKHPTAKLLFREPSNCYRHQTVEAITNKKQCHLQRGPNMLSAQQKTKYMKNRARIKITTDTELGFPSNQLIPDICNFFYTDKIFEE